MGLLTSADRLDPARGAAFSTYARYWIAETPQRAAIQSLPVHVLLHVAKANYECSPGLDGRHGYGYQL